MYGEFQNKALSSSLGPPSILPEMRVALQEEYDKLQPADLKYINSMPEKIQELKSSRGMKTPD
jgi:hypothetical protein